ncbi:MAG: AAA family ATPase [Gemmatimonadaceae bacterium]
MKLCSACAFENEDSMRFCGGCGTKLPAACPTCGFENPPNFRFCGSCGGSLAPSPAPGATRPTAPNTPPLARASTPSSARVTLPDARPDRVDAERRQLTVLFCDLVESTALAERLDDEIYRDTVRAYQQACADIVAQFDGHIAQYLGDGILVYFGYPHAHEDDARRAALAALGMLEAVRTLPIDTRVRAIMPALAVRVGIHTGTVIAGDVGGGSTREKLALGSTPNIAARLQSIAEPNGILLSGETERLLNGWFDVESLGTQELRGVSKPVGVFRVLREAKRNGRFELDDARRLSPLVGRDEELALLTRRLTMSREGNGSIVLLSGEAGVGKSRLVQATRIRAVEEGFTCIVGRSASVHQSSALLPVVDLLEGMIGFEQDATAAERLARIEEFLDELLLPREESVQLLATLLSASLGNSYAALNTQPQRQRARTVELLVQILTRSAERRPHVLVMEDLHWADPSTLEFLTTLIDQPPIRGLLVIFTVRPEFEVPWRSRSHVTHLTLSRLSDKDVRTMILQMSGTASLPAALIAQVVQKTDGIPVFVEELTRMMLELGIVSGGAMVDPTTLLHLMEVPETLQDSLLARLDRLGDAKDVAQIGAVLGRTFDYDLMLSVSAYGETALQQQLARLVDAELLYQRGTVPNATYTFKHALIQEAAYGLLLRSSRRTLHERVADVITEQFPALAAAQPELLAHHLTEAARTMDAVQAWTQAGMRAMERSALAEAVSQLRRGLTLLDTLPESRERDAIELNTLTTLATAYSSPRGYAAPETIAAYARANAISERLGEAKEIFWVVVGLWVSTYVSGDLPKALEIAHRLARIAENEGLEMRMEAQYCLGASYRFLGELPLARRHLENVLAMDYPGRVLHSRTFTALDIVTTSASIASECCWLLGDSESAFRLKAFAIREAARLAHPLSMGVAETSACWLGVASGDRDAVLRHATNTTQLSEQFGLFLIPVAAIYLGWVNNDPATIGNSLTMFLMGGSKIGTTHFYSLQAEAYWRSGDTVSALLALDSAEAMMDVSGERNWDSALMRIRGDILLSDNRATEAEACFRLAVERAEARGAEALRERAQRSLDLLVNAPGH